MNRKICFFGHFGAANFGNEITLQTILHEFRRRLPTAKFACICTGPEVLAAKQEIETIAIRRTLVQRQRLRNRLARWLRRLFVGLPAEVGEWLDAFKRLKGTNMLVVPGTGLLTDAYGVFGWGPYNLLKWSFIAKLRGCKLVFVSVGAGPLRSQLGRYFVKSALSMADFRSYRDAASMAHLKDIGFRTNGDRIYPDLAFSLNEIPAPNNDETQAGKPIIGLGLIAYAGMLSAERLTNEVYLAYLENLVTFAGWLLAQGYMIRLLIGDVSDRSVLNTFKSQLKASFKAYDERRIIDQPADSVEELLPQIAATEIVVATRFHNVLLALALSKPVVAISFHHKSTSLMNDMGLAEYCHDIIHMDVDRLIEQFQNAERNAGQLKPVIRQRVEASRRALAEQYQLILRN